MAVDRYRLAEVTDEMWESVPVNRISANAVLSSVVGGFKWWMHHLNSSWIFSSGVYQLRTFLGRPLSRS